ncbi:unnamed protein product [Rhizophagus irregularis]|nr:unnamed protein product [Rhizophagus irregularis]
MSSQDHDNFVQKNNNNNERSPLIRHWQWPQQPQQQFSQQPQQLQQLQQSQWPQQPQQQFSQQPQQLQQHQQSQWPQQPQHHQQSQWPQQPQHHQWSQPQPQLSQWSQPQPQLPQWSQPQPQLPQWSQPQPQLPQWPRPQSQLPQWSFGFILPEYINLVAEKEYKKSRSPVTTSSSPAESLPTSLHSPHLPHTRTPMDEIENELVEAGISLPEKYFVNGRYPKTSRPSAKSPNELSDPSGYSSLNQQQLSSILLINSMPKWVRNFIINELKPLFLRTRHLDQSSKNRIIQDFLTILFPKFVELHPDKLNEVAKSFRKTWSYWRNMLWDKINESSSGLNIAASMNLSKYEINYEDYEDELIVCSSSEDEDEGQRTKGTPKKQSTNKRNI